MSNASPSENPLPADFRQLRILSVSPGESYFVRCLSEEYRGTFTHFNRRSYLCGGKDCPTHLHSRFDVCWKGYASVDVWYAPRKVWVPYVLEITEHLELDFRGIWARGQVWEMFREIQQTKKVTPVQAKLHEERDPKSVPPAFDFVPVLLTRYHARSIDLNIKNPLPPRVFVKESEGEGPAALKPTERAAIPEDFSFAAEAAKRAAQKKRAPSDKKPT